MTQIIKKGIVLFMSAVMFLCCGAFDFSYVDAATWNPSLQGTWTDANTFTIDTGSTVKTNENTKSLINWANYSDQKTPLADGDTVTADGSKLKIHVAAGYSSVKKNNNNRLILEPGSITNGNGDTFSSAKEAYISSVDSAITGLSADSTKIPAEGGKVTVNVAGRLLDMDSSFSFKVYIDGSAPTDFIYTDFKVNSATSGTLTFTAPANTDAKEHVYTVKAKKGFNSPYADIDQSFQMTQAAGSGETPSKDPAITSLSYSATSFTSAGGQVTVTVKGSNLKDLTKENLPFTPKLMTSVYYEDLGTYGNTDVLGDYTWTAVDDTQGTITFTLPENTETTDKTYTFKMKKGANGYYDTAELSGTDQALTVAGKAATVKKFTPVIEESNWIDKNTIKIHFAEPVSLTSDAKAKIQLAKQPLAAEDMVTASGNDVIITIAGGYKYGNVVFGEGALTNGKGAVSNEVTAYTNATSKVTKVAFNKTSFDSKGGEVSVDVTGTCLDFGDFDLLPVLYCDGSETTDVKLNYTIKDSSSASLTFTLPENTGDNAKSYELKFKKGQWGTSSNKDIEGITPLTVAGKTGGQTTDPEKKTFKLDVDDWSASNYGDGRIVVTFNKNVSLNPAVNINDYIYFSYGYEGSATRTLTADDKVSMDGNVMTIQLKDTEASIPGYLCVKADGLKDKSGAFLGDYSRGADHKTYIKNGAHIDSMSYNKITFDSKGGELVGTIKGTQLDKSSPAINFQIFRNNDKLSTADMNVDVTVKDPTTAEFRVVLPENKTDKPVSYRILPRVDGINAYTAYIKGYDVITVLPAGADPNASVISSITISGGNDVDDAPDVLETTMDSGVVSYKLNVYIRGANLSSKKTAVKVVDENGIEWPAHPVFECGATIRWQNSASYLPELESKNEQAIEMLAPRALGKDHTFKLYFAPDGKNFQDSPVGTVIVHNDHVIDIPSGFSYEQLTQLKSVKVKYVDEQGNEIAKTDEYPAYAVTELYNLGIKAKNIKGYTLKTSTPDPDTLKEYLKMPDQNEDGQYTNANYFVAHLGDDPVITYIYSRDKTVPADQYWVAEGDKATWTKGSDSGLKIRFQYGDKAADEANGTFDKFTGKLTLDGRDLKADQFTASKGSLNVELNPELMNSLSAGKHTLTAEFTDGSATAEFTVAAAGTSGGNGESSNVQPGKGGKTTVQTVKTVKTVNAVRTGDESSLGLYAVVLMIAAGLALVISYRRKASK